MIVGQWMTQVRSARAKYIAALLVGLLAAPAAQALDAAQWRAVAPAIQAALECRTQPDTDSAAWKALARSASGEFKPITPPVPFAVFGLPVREVSIYIDPDGDLGESYTTAFNASPAAVRKAAKLAANAGRTTTMGELMLGEGNSSLTCTVMGSYDESDYQEP
jgi:hypothetical protein